MGRTPAGETREKVFAFVRDRLLAGQPPTVREVQEALGFRAVRTAQQHLERLVEDGRLIAGRHRARGYRLPGSTPGARTVLARCWAAFRPGRSTRPLRIRTAICRSTPGARRPATCSRCGCAARA